MDLIGDTVQSVTKENYLEISESFTEIAKHLNTFFKISRTCKQWFQILSYKINRI